MHQCLLATHNYSYKLASYNRLCHKRTPIAPQMNKGKATWQQQVLLGSENSDTCSVYRDWSSHLL